MAERKSLPKEQFVKATEIDDDEDAEYAIVPPDGGWGWVVVFAAFYINIVIDGVLYTFGIFLEDLSKYFHTELSNISLIYSILFGTHFIMGIACAGFSSVFGIRIVTCTGSLIAAFGFGVSSVVDSYKLLYFTYGIIGGIGFGLMLMNTLIAPTIYFERWRGLAVAVTMMGTGVGAVLFPYAGNQISKYATWQTAFQAQAVAAGSLFFAGLTFRPLKPKRIVTSEDAPAFTVEQTSTVIRQTENKREETGHSSLDAREEKSPTIYYKKTVYDGPVRGMSMAHFSTIALQDVGMDAATRGARKYFKKPALKSALKKPGERKERKQDILLVNPETKQDLFRDEENAFKSSTSQVTLRPPRYFESRTQAKSTGSSISRVMLQPSRFLNTLASDSTTFIYSKAPGGFDSYAGKGQAYCKPFMTSMKNMLNCQVLKSPAYCVFAITGATSACGLIIIMTYQQDRAVKQAGIDSDTATYFVMTFGAANTLWRLFLGIVSVFPKTKPIYGLVFCTIIGGLATLISGLSFHPAYQYMFSICAGLALAAFAVLRPVIMVDLVGLEKVSNATGIKFVMMGIGAICGPPLSGKVMEVTNDYNTVFYIAGALITGSGFAVSLTEWLHRKEDSVIKEPKELF